MQPFYAWQIGGGPQVPLPNSLPCLGSSSSWSPPLPFTQTNCTRTEIRGYLTRTPSAICLINVPLFDRLSRYMGSFGSYLGSGEPVALKYPPPILDPLCSALICCSWQHQHQSLEWTRQVCNIHSPPNSSLLRDLWATWGQRGSKVGGHVRACRTQIDQLIRPAIF